MGFYQRRVLPCLVNVAMRQTQLRPHRERLAGAALGRVLEIGVGSGLNLPFYHRSIAEVVGIDPSEELLALAAKQAAWVHFPVKLHRADAAALPLESGSFDSAVMTWTLCSIADPIGALAEIRRVLRPRGRLLFIEHGRAPEAAIQRWQDRLTPVWRRIGGNCHLNRRVDTLIEAGGLKLAELETGYLLNGPRIATFHYRGVATPG